MTFTCPFTAAQGRIPLLDWVNVPFFLQCPTILSPFWPLTPVTTVPNPSPLPIACFLFLFINLHTGAWGRFCQFHHLTQTIIGNFLKSFFFSPPIVRHRERALSLVVAQNLAFKSAEQKRKLPSFFFNFTFCHVIAVVIAVQFILWHSISIHVYFHFFFFFFKVSVTNCRCKQAPQGNKCESDA